MPPLPLRIFFFFFNDTATTEIYTLSLHDALPIYVSEAGGEEHGEELIFTNCLVQRRDRSEEHTSELQSPDHLVCRLLLEKKKQHVDPNALSQIGHSFSFVQIRQRPCNADSHRPSQ